MTSGAPPVLVAVTCCGMLAMLRGTVPKAPFPLRDRLGEPPVADRLTVS